MSPPAVFISYSRKEIELASSLRADLESFGIHCVMDNDFDIGKPFPPAIHQSILEADAVVAVLTRGYLDSTWCTMEMALSFDSARVVHMLADTQGTVERAIAQEQRVRDRIIMIMNGGGEHVPRLVRDIYAHHDRTRDSRCEERLRHRPEVFSSEGEAIQAIPSGLGGELSLVGVSLLTKYGLLSAHMSRIGSSAVRLLICSEDPQRRADWEGQVATRAVGLRKLARNLGIDAAVRTQDGVPGMLYWGGEGWCILGHYVMKPLERGGAEITGASNPAFMIRDIALTRRYSALFDRLWSAAHPIEHSQNSALADAYRSVAEGTV